MKIIGITGGVGSGKSEVANYVGRNYYAFLIFSDLVGYSLNKKGACNYNNIINAFGKSILDENSEIDRKKLRELTFTNKENLELLSSVTWPNIVLQIEAIVNEMKEYSLYDYIIIESAMLFESGLSKLCDEIWHIYVNKEERIKRLQKSRNYSLETCNTLIDYQMADKEFSEKEIIKIDNSVDFNETKKQIDILLSKIL